MVGATFSHYRILDRLGAGGMGTVYHALDTDLNRHVAIKFLRPEFAAQAERRERFLREARSAAALTHPNICTIHEVGRTDEQLFIVMQLVGGRTLADRIGAGPIDAEIVGRVALQLAEALREAHSHGIVHRDLKPANIMIGDDNVVTILDFGVAAMLKGPVALADVSTMTGHPLTQPGALVGTIGYMAPEQIRGEPAEPAIDVFSLGATLYEAASGRNPFRCSYYPQAIAAVLQDTPPALRSILPDFPACLDGIILKCLDRDPQLRYPDGEAVAQALREGVFERPASRERQRHRSIVVLPFRTREGDDEGYLGEALTAEIITRLARLKGVLVISRSSAERYRKSTLDTRRIGQELGVETVLDGSISRQDDKYRITVQLLEVSSGFCVWAHRYDFAADDLFQIQESMADRVARALRTQFPATASQSASGTANADAYRLYLQGKTLFHRFNSTDNLLAIEAFQRALKLDSRYAEAHAGVAAACMARVDREWEADETRWVSAALEACDTALALDAWVSEAYAAKGLVFLRQQRLDEAHAEFGRALAINPNDDVAHCMRGRILFETGDLKSAVRAYKRALKISPDYVWCWNDLAWVYWLLGRFDETERSLVKALMINPVDEIARVGIATGHYFRGELDAAIEVAERSIEINPHHPFARPVLAVALARHGRAEEARAICDETLRARPHDFLTSAALGVVHAIAGDAEELRIANEHALSIRAPRSPLNTNIAVHYAFLNHPRYAQLWLAKARREGMQTDAVLAHNALLRQLSLAPE